jgi:hypothetical protein
MHAHNALKVLFAGILIAGLAACESGPEIRADGDPSVNLTSYKTFGFFDRASTDKAGYGTILTTRLKDSTWKELEKRGYQHVDTNPQLVVNFNVNVQDKTKVTSTPSSGVGYYGYRAGMYGTWAGYPQDIQTVNYRQGTLAIDIVDAARKQVVWQGIAEGKVTKSMTDNPGAAIDSIVGDIFAKYPVPAAGAPAQK